MEYHAWIEIYELLLHTIKYMNLIYVKEVKHKSIHTAQFHSYKGLKKKGKSIVLSQESDFLLGRRRE